MVNQKIKLIISLFLLIKSLFKVYIFFLFFNLSDCALYKGFGYLIFLFFKDLVINRNPERFFIS